MTLSSPNLPALDECIAHRNWLSALDEAFALLVTAQPSDVICLVGPSRAGKTRLIQRLSSLLSGNNDFEQSGELPVVAVEASNTGPNGRFSTKSFVHQMLHAVRHPLYTGYGLDPTHHTNLDRKPEHELRRALELALQHRKTRYLFIDEAQHARYATRDSLAVMDSWKCLGRAGNVVLVLVGAYPMLDIIRDSPHMVGRKREVHLARYGSDTEDLKEFTRIVNYYEQELSSVCSDKFSLVRQLEMLHTGSLGCIGLLRSWLLYAAALAHANHTTIDQHLLKRSMHSDADRAVVLREISDGEHLLRSSDPIRKQQLESPPTMKKSGKTLRTGKPFQRKPKRFKPGGRGDENMQPKKRRGDQ